MDDGTVETCVAAADAVSKAPSYLNHADILRHLKALLSDREDDDLRWSVIRALGNTADEATQAEVTPALLEYLRHDSLLVRMQVAETLGLWKGTTGPEVTKALLRAARFNRKLVSWRANLSLARLDPCWDNLEPLVSAMDSRDLGPRQEAAAVLGLLNRNHRIIRSKWGWAVRQIYAVPAK